MPGRLRRRLAWSYLGRVPYAEAVCLQERLRDGLRRGEEPERLLLLEHPHVYTLGRRAAPGELLATPDWLAARGVEVAECDRGGRITYHGPGQLVGYPLLDLDPDRRDIRRYVRDLQRVLVRTLADWEIEAEAPSEAERIGVWVDGRKIASIGVHVSRWLTTHGFALNVTTDLTYFRGIVACGLEGVTMTSIEAETGERPSLETVSRRLTEHFGSVFDRQLEEAEMPASAVR